MTNSQRYKCGIRKGKTLTNIEITASDDAVVEAAIVLPCGNVVVHNANGDGINGNVYY
jgi:hypothetical protein